MIRKLDSLDIKPDGDFFDYESFYSTLNEKNISKEEYENVKKVFKLLRLKTLGDLNKIYNFQDTAILFEIFEKRSSQLQEIFKYNPRKCNSASASSGFVQRLKSKCCIALPFDAEIGRVFEQTLIGGYSCVNTRMAFDAEVFLKDVENEKVLFKTEDNQLKRFFSKIIKMDENNQYGMAMTRPLPYGCIKRKKQVLSIEDLTVDIEFADINEKTLLFNEIYPTIFEKKKIIPPYERSTCQIISRAEKKNSKNEISKLPFN